MRGRNTVVIHIRIPDEVYLELERLGNKEGLSVGLFVRKKLLEYVEKVREVYGTGQGSEEEVSEGVHGEEEV